MRELIEKKAKELGEILYTYGTEDMSRELCILLGEELAKSVLLSELRARVEELESDLIYDVGTTMPEFEKQINERIAELNDQITALTTNPKGDRNE